MKKLQRMLMIHWHNYQFELIEFAKINFMTGKTAAGKSTVIDALQLVLLGETGGTFFNKAANKKSNRSATSAQERLIKAYNATSTDNDNINDQHNTQKQALGRNTKV